MLKIKFKMKKGAKEFLSLIICCVVMYVGRLIFFLQIVSQLLLDRLIDYQTDISMRQLAFFYYDEIDQIVS